MSMLNLQNLTKSGTHRPVISEDDARECPYVKQKKLCLRPLPDGKRFPKRRKGGSHFAEKLETDPKPE